MTRVSENSSAASINYSIGKSKGQLENLQIQGANLKRIQKPSDDPSGNTDLMAIKSRSVDAKQFERNAAYSKAFINFTESTLEDITNILVKAKEIAIGQASNYYNKEVREGVSKEVEQLRTQLLGLANKRFGNRYIFAGYKTTTIPFDKQGHYHGDNGKIKLEVSKDVFVPVNLTGAELFMGAKKKTSTQPIEKLEQDLLELPAEIEEALEIPTNLRDIASDIQNDIVAKEDKISSLFDHLQSLQNALVTNNNVIIQDLLPAFDEDFDRVNSLRAQIGAITNTVENAEQGQEKLLIIHQQQRSKIEDADVAELFTELEKQKNVLQATYKTSANLMNQSLINFLK